jgi:hypothetical protein
MQQTLKLTRTITTASFAMGLSDRNDASEYQLRDRTATSLHHQVAVEGHSCTDVVESYCVLPLDRD